MKLNVSAAEFYQAVNDEVLLEECGLFRHLMTNFSAQLGSFQRADTHEIEKQRDRVQSEIERTKAKQPQQRRTDA